MPVITRSLTVSTHGNSDIIDITSKVQDILSSASPSDGIVTIFVPGSTASITTIEYEPGLAKDFPQAMERFAPANIRYEHDLKWGDGNGHSHVRASTVGPGLVIPFQDKHLMLGTWQQIILIDFDVKPRTRKVIVQVMGE